MKISSKGCLASKVKGEVDMHHVGVSMAPHSLVPGGVLGFTLASSPGRSHFSSLLTLARASEDEIFIIMKA